MEFKKEGFKKYTCIILLLCFITTLSGCTSIKTGSTTSAGDVYKGTEGLEISFIDNTLAQKIYVTPDTKLPISLKIENKGATSLEYDDIKIFYEGFDHDYITGIKYEEYMSSDFEPIEGKSSYNPEGGSSLKIFESGNILLPSNLNSYNPNFVVSWLYNYQTIASTTVCVDPRPYQITGIQKPCTPQDVTLSGGQGAPVAVTKVEVIPGSSRTTFRIHIKNIGSGSIVNRYINSPSEIGITSANKIDEYSVLVGNKYVYCQPEVLQFFDKNTEAILQCQHYHEVDEDNAYETVIQVRLNYKYYDSVSQQLQLIKVDDYEDRLISLLGSSGYSSRDEFRDAINTINDIEQAIRMTERTIDSWQNIGR